ncbi:MAG: hypothetical protein AB2L07_14975 [Thermoanaerobaculaceae bacterium]
MGEPSIVLRPRSGRRHVLWMAVALAVVGIVSGVLVWRELQHPSRSRAGEARPAVAVLGFVNLAQDAGTAWLGNAFTETLGSELAASERLRQVSGEEVARLRADLGLAEVSTLAPATLARVRGLTGADLVVSGAYTVFPGQTGARVITLQVSVQDTGSGERSGGFAEKGTETELFELISRAGSRLREELAGGHGGVATATLGASFGGSQEAARLYADGLARLREFDVQAARQLLEEAARLAPEAPLVHLALADAYASLAQTARAAESARRALELSDHLSPEQKRLAEGRVAELARDWPRAIEIYAALVRDVPDSLDYGLRLGDAQLAAAKSAQALETAEMLRRQLPQPLRDDPRLDILEARAAYYLSDHKRQLEAAQRGERKARERGARLVEARAMDAAGSAQRLLGDLDGAMASLQKARAMYAAVGSRRNVARVLNSIGNVLFDQHDIPGAVEAYQQAADGFRAVGDRQTLALQLHNLAWPVFTVGSSSRARAHLDESVAILRELDDSKELTVALHKLGSVLLDLGDVAGAREALEESAGLANANGRRQTESARPRPGWARCSGSETSLGEGPLGLREVGRYHAAAPGPRGRIEGPGPAAAVRRPRGWSPPGRCWSTMAPLAAGLTENIDPPTTRSSSIAVLARAQGDGRAPRRRGAPRSPGLGAAAARSSKPAGCRSGCWSSARSPPASAARPGGPATLASEARSKAHAGGFVPTELEAPPRGGPGAAGGRQTARHAPSSKACRKDARARGFLLIARKAAQAGHPTR